VTGSDIRIDHTGHRRRGVLLLSFVTLLWGTTFVVIKSALSSTSPSVITCGRFFISAVVFLPFLRGHFRRSSLGLWLAGVEVGFWLAVCYGAQAEGLRYTTAGRSAFITALNVILTPILCFFLRHRINPWVWPAAVLAFAGTGLLCYDGSHLNVGDLWTLMCAATWSVYIVRVETFTRRWPATELTAVQLLGVFAFSAVWLVLDGKAGMTSLETLPWAAVLYLGLAATAVTTWLQTISIRHVAASSAAILFTMEPVWAALLAYFVFQERMSPQALCGAALIVAGAIFGQWPRSETAKAAA
jgi:drug/metabolite transporter (DMT)-like permease